MAIANVMTQINAQIHAMIRLTFFGMIVLGYYVLALCEVGEEWEVEVVCI